ncbi:MAG: DNA polymerase I [Clostridia bacterium]|nr:DNA polymerase I [Clostridia bacterium]
MKNVLLVDGNSILNRAFYGVRPLTTGKGLPVNALYGMLNMLQKQLEAVRPDYAAVAFDVSRHTFRHRRFEQYKAGRKPMPEELAAQLSPAKELVRALGFHVLEKQDYEADDLLGTFSRKAVENGYHAYIFTGDRDSLQLIDDSTSVILATNKENVNYDRAAFTVNYGIPPEQYVYVKALMGDSSDNIPGVPGIGERTALKLIAQFGSLDALYADIPSAEAGASAKAKLEAGKESAYTSLWLATIDRNVPTDTDIEDIAYSGWNRRELYRLLTEFEFVSNLKRFGLSSEEFASEGNGNTATDGGDGAVTPSRDGGGAESEGGASVGDGGVSLGNGGADDSGRRRSEVIAETVEACSVSESGITDGADVAMYIDGCSAYLFEGARLCRLSYPDVRRLYRDISGHGLRLTVWDSKTLLSEIALNGGDPLGVCIRDDIMLGGYVLNPSSHAYDLPSLCTVYLAESIASEPALVSVQVSRIAREMKDRLAESGQESLYRDVEIPLAAVLSDMEREGFRVDTAGLTEFGNALSLLAEEYTQRIYMAAGHEFNINSPKQLGEVLFGELKLPHGKKTQTGYSTSADILEKLRADHPIVDDILEYRSVTKLRSTYAVGLCEAADVHGRVHSSFNQTVTVTGRLSSTEPNLQNIPIRTQLGRELRRFFVPSNGDRVLIDADYSQIELRLLAHIADDRGMIDGFISGEDIHRITASQVFGVPLERVTPELRKQAKAVNFGIVYGIGGFSLAADIGVSKKEADQYIKSYFEKYPGISAYLSDVVERGKRDGFVETIFGRRRYIPELTSSKAMMRAFGERVAMNSPIQGSSADIIKMAMVAVSRRLREEIPEAKLILQVHDELIVEAPACCAERAAEILKDAMENVVSLSVPLTVELSVGSSWFECK